MKWVNSDHKDVLHQLWCRGKVTQDPKGFNSSTSLLSSNTTVVWALLTFRFDVTHDYTLFHPHAL